MMPLKTSEMQGARRCAGEIMQDMTPKSHFVEQERDTEE